MISNEKPVDRLATVRERIAELQAEEKEIRAGILDGSIGLEGDFAVASILKRSQKHLDREALKDELGDLSRFMKPVEIVTVRLTKLEPVEVDE